MCYLLWKNRLLFRRILSFICHFKSSKKKKIYSWEIPFWFEAEALILQRILSVLKLS